MFETEVVPASECQSQRQVCRQGLQAYEAILMSTHSIPFSKEKKNTLYYPKFTAAGFFPRDLNYQFETAVVNKPLVFKPLKFYCI